MNALTSNETKQPFAEDFLIRLRKVFNCLQPGKIRESVRDGMVYFNSENTMVCIFNAHSSGVQLILNRSLLSLHFDSVYDCAESEPPDWRALVTLLTDAVDQLYRQMNLSRQRSPNYKIDSSCSKK